MWTELLNKWAVELFTAFFGHLKKKKNPELAAIIDRRLWALLHGG